MSRCATFAREPGSDACSGAPVGSALARGAGASRWATLQGHVLRAAPQERWHPIVEQVLLLVVQWAGWHVAPPVSGRDSTVWRYAWLREVCVVMHTVLPPVLGCWNRHRVHGPPPRAPIEPHRVVRTNWWGTQLGRWARHGPAGAAAPPPLAHHPRAPCSAAACSEAERDLMWAWAEWQESVSRSPPQRAAGEGQVLHIEAEACERWRNGGACELEACERWRRTRAGPRRTLRAFVPMPPIEEPPPPDERLRAEEQARRERDVARAARRADAAAVEARVAAERAELLRGMRPPRAAYPVRPKREPRSPVNSPLLTLSLLCLHRPTQPPGRGRCARRVQARRLNASFNERAHQRD